MTQPVMLWDEIPVEQRASEASSYQGWGATTWRGCRAAVQWRNDPLWHRCSAQAPASRGLCSKHTERVQGTPFRTDPGEINQRVWNAIHLHRWRHPGRVMTVAEFRALRYADITAWRMVGVGLAGAIHRVKNTWSDEELIESFGFLRSVWESAGEGACNWVGEGTPA